MYGSNDWYYAYGKNTAEGILRDADLVKGLAPAGGPAPFTVIDDGYQDAARFPDMAKLASEIRNRGVKPGFVDQAAARCGDCARQSPAAK